MPECDESKNAASLDINDLGDKNDIQGLISIVKYGSPGKKKTAIRWLGQLSGKEAVKCLLETALNKQGGIAVIRNAILALGYAGDHSVVEPLIYLMGAYQYPDVKRAAAVALGELKDEKAIGALALLMNDEEQDIFTRGGAAEALCKIGTEGAFANVVSALEDNRLGNKVANALMGAGEKAVQPLISNLDVQRKSKVVEILGKIGSKQAAKPLLKLLGNEISLGFGNTYDHGNSNLEAVVRALVAVGDTEITKQAVEKLLGAMRLNPLPGDVDYPLQNMLLFALGESQDEQAIEPLVKQLLASHEQRIKWTAAHALAILGVKINDSEIIHQLAEVLNNEQKHRQYIDLSGWRNCIAWALVNAGKDQGWTAVVVNQRNGTLFKPNTFR